MKTLTLCCIVAAMVAILLAFGPLAGWHFVNWLGNTVGR